MRNLLAASVLLSVVLFAGVIVGLRGASAAQAVSIAGTYAVEGANADASTYHGRAEVTEHDGLISVQILDPAGEVMSIGIGLRDGNVISLIFQTRDGAIGLASYRLEDEKWIGRWVIPGTADILTETFVKADPRLHGAEIGPKSIL